MTATGPCGRTSSAATAWTSSTSARTTRNLLPFELATLPGEPAPLHARIREQLRRAILDGRVPPGLRLPSSRLLAQQLACARGTVLLALEQLAAEGYVETVAGSGTFVARDLPEDLLHSPAPAAARPRPAATPRLSARTEKLLGRPSAPLPPSSVPAAFALGRPALDAFPFALWARLLESEWRAPVMQTAEGLHPFGDDRLRQAIAAYLATARGFACDPAAVLVTAGVRQSLMLLARLLCDPGEPAWVEDPGYGGVLDALAGAGLLPVPVPVDAEGFPLEAALQLAPRARLVVVTPAHQYPLGVTLSLARRLALLQWAEASDGWIVEDDYDGEYRYAGRPLAPLRALDRNGRVAYVGSFSKVLFPSLRLGYLVLPAALVPCAERLLAVQGPGTSALGQGALARFIAEGHFAAHLRRTRRLYAERQTVLVQAATDRLLGQLVIPADPAGMHLVARPSPEHSGNFDDQRVTALAAQAGVAVVPLSQHHAGPVGREGQGLLLGYAALTPGTIKAAVARLAATLSAYRSWR